MSEKRPSRTTPALALLCVACLLPLLLPATAHATNRTIYVMGYGGITPTSVCPICSTVVCAVITNDGLEPLHWETTGGGSQYDIELNTGVPEPLTAIQGSDLDVKSVTPK